MPGAAARRGRRRLAGTDRAGAAAAAATGPATPSPATETPADHQSKRRTS